MTAPSDRLASLDAFRGLSVAAMIVVNNPGNWAAVFPQLTHAAWHGCTVADVVFPFFLFIMGMAMPLAFARRRKRQGPDVSVVGHLDRRKSPLRGTSPTVVG